MPEICGPQRGVFFLLPEVREPYAGAKSTFVVEWPKKQW